MQNFASQTTAHLALYNIGIYAQDEWQANSKLKLTLGARIDRTGNPLCHNGCFSSYMGQFPNAGASLTQPYASGAGGPINAQNWHPFPKVQVFNFQPRFGFNYSLTPRLEVRGGAGIFSDLYPAGFLDGAIQNFPNVNSVTVLNGNLGNGGAGTVTGNAIAANDALQAGFAAGQSITDINTALSAAGIPFTPPAINAYFPGTFRVPEYAEYSLQFQDQISRSDAIIVTYAGNHGYDEVLQNPYENPAVGYFNATGTDSAWDNALPAIGNLPVTPPDPSFSRVTAYTNNAKSNYNGGLLTWKHQGQGITSEFSYTWSHSLDTVSNGGEGEPYNGGSVLDQLTPSLFSDNLNYSNSDYDVRHNFVGDIVWTEPYKAHNAVLNSVLGGWVIGGKTYARTGSPFTITNGEIGNVGYTNLGTAFMPQTVSGSSHVMNTTDTNPHSAVMNSGLGDCTQFVGFASLSNAATPCGSVGDQSTFGNVRRNSLYGPHYVNTDLSLLKKIVSRERVQFEIGANAYNAFNHPNFSNPNATLGQASFGLITSVVAPPTSPYGSFQGAAVTQRILQVHGRLTF